MTCWLGIDLGGTKTILGVVDAQGCIKKSILLETRVHKGPETIVKDIVSVAGELCNSYNISGTGVGMAGQIVKDTGVVHFAPNLGWKDFPLQEALRNALKMPVAVTNDVRAAAWGEWFHGAGKGYRDLVCIFVGTGIGGGIVTNGKMITGNSNTAGEIGHMVVDLNGPACTCGSRGCFDAIAGGGGIARRARQMVGTDPLKGKLLVEMAGGNAEEIDAKHVFEAYRQKLPLAIMLMEEVKAGLVAGVTSVVNAFNPALVIMGGGVINGNPELVEVIHNGVSKMALEAAVIDLKIVHAALQANAGVVGAATFIKHNNS